MEDVAQTLVSAQQDPTNIPTPLHTPPTTPYYHSTHSSPQPPTPTLHLHPPSQGVLLPLSLICRDQALLDHRSPNTQSTIDQTPPLSRGGWRPLCAGITAWSTKMGRLGKLKRQSARYEDSTCVSLCTFRVAGPHSSHALQIQSRKSTSKYLRTPTSLGTISQSKLGKEGDWLWRSALSRELNGSRRLFICKRNNLRMLVDLWGAAQVVVVYGNDSTCRL